VQKAHHLFRRALEMTKRSSVPVIPTWRLSEAGSPRTTIREPLDCSFGVGDAVVELNVLERVSELIDTGLFNEDGAMLLSNSVTTLQLRCRRRYSDLLDLWFLTRRGTVGRLP
jgi:hypothetical protein